MACAGEDADTGRPKDLLRIIGIAGFGGKGTELTAEYLFQQENLACLDRAFQKIDDATPKPMFLVARVEFVRGDSKDNLEEKVEFIAESGGIN